MKTSIGIVLLGAVVTMTTPVQAQTRESAPQAASRPAPHAKILKRGDIDALLAQPSKVLVIDVRRPDELTAIGGFPVYLSIQAADLEKQLAAIPKDRLIITVSNNASRAARAADLLEKNGFNVAGAAGAQDYEADGGTLVKIAPRTAAASESRSR